jgi:hypothetical protein
VIITDQLNYYHDIEAENIREAMKLTREALNNEDDPLTPTQDNYNYEGYEVKDAYEIPKEKSDLN